MALIKLTSTNPKLSYLLYKNPASGIQLRRIRKGMGYGWYQDEQNYLAYFTEQGATSLSFRPNREEAFHYLNAAQYHAPLAYLSLMTEFLSHPLKMREGDTEGFQHRLEVAFVALKREHYLEHFQQQLPDIHITYKEASPGHGNLVFETQRPIHDLLHGVQLFLIFQALFGKEFLDETQGLVEKYMQSLNAVDAPFYLRNLFVRHFLSRRDYFNRFKVDAEATQRYSINFAYGGTNLQRRNVAEELLDFQHPILDVGCGEGFYIPPLANKLEGRPYYAIDINPEVLDVAREKVEKKELENVSFYGSLDQWLETPQEDALDVIIMEVVEHMPVADAAKLLKQLLNQPIHQLVLSTPNKDFNPYYQLTHEQRRHPDHQWEMTQAQFRTWIEALVDQEQYTLELLEIGDKVNGIPTTQGARILRKETEEA